MLEIIPLLNTNDDAILADLLLKLLPQFPKLLAFYLGYCQPNKEAVTTKVKLVATSFYIPLQDDWFIRPLFHLEYLD